VQDQALRARKKKWIVRADREGARLDSFVRRCIPTLSRKAAEAAIAAGVFRVNGQKGKKGDRVRCGDIVRFEGPEDWLAEGPLPEPTLQAAILYEDSHLMVVDKPAGMDTHGFSGRDMNTLANFLAAERPGILGIGKSRWEPGLVHRLDRETSGLVLVAKTQSVFERLRVQFEERQIRKYYWSLVWGSTRRQGSIDYPIAHQRRDKRRMRVIMPPSKLSKTEKSWDALTRYQRLTTGRKFSFLEIEITTGVMHQIRVHLAAIGHPIVGDALYGVNRADTLGLKRHFLHACRVQFRHPMDQRKLTIESPLPPELGKILTAVELNS
jgi:23S rRNA pseudouridine1911/1915/1917 synthase